MNFQIQDTLTVPPALANGWVFARGDAVSSFGP
jgi:hypothetical protein